MVPKRSSHSYRILEPLTEVEATHPRFTPKIGTSPECAGRRDDAHGHRVIAYPGVSLIP